MEALITFLDLCSALVNIVIICTELSDRANKVLWTNKTVTFWYIYLTVTKIQKCSVNKNNRYETFITQQSYQ